MCLVLLIPVLAYLVMLNRDIVLATDGECHLFYITPQCEEKAMYYFETQEERERTAQWEEEKVILVLNHSKDNIYL